LRQWQVPRDTLNFLVAARILYVAGGCYASAGPDRAQTMLVGGYALPGLVDMHNHLSLRSPAVPTGPPRDWDRGTAARG
jgi:imidazolonepropionase-like amidohydrolase